MGINQRFPNAIKFSSGLAREGQVVVQARVSEEKSGHVWVEISVQDNGIGMDETTRERLFQPFQQADASTTRRYGGTGLGLVISRRLAELMGGEMKMESTLDIGSTLTLHIPFAHVDETTLPAILEMGRQGAQIATCAPAPTREAALRQGRLILVAEDNVINQDVIRQQLNLLGFAADLVGDGREAFACWMTGDYALVLSDLHMPHMDGYQLTTSIREQEAKAGAGHTPVVALTANAMSGEAGHCKAAGMDDYLAKPASLVDLKAMLEKWLPQAEAARNAPTGKPAPQPVERPAEAADILWDGEVLTRMVGNNPPMHRRLLERFLSNAQEQVSTLSSAVAAEDAAVVSSVAHSLKSAARTVGAMQLGWLCQEIEKASKGGDGSACKLLAGRLNGVFVAAAEKITQNLSEPL